MFGNVYVAFGQILDNLRNSSESGRKSSEKSSKMLLWVCIAYMVACRYGRSLQVLSVVSAANEWDITLNTRRDVPIYAHPCIILYKFYLLSYTINAPSSWKDTHRPRWNTWPGTEGIGIDQIIVYIIILSYIYSLDYNLGQNLLRHITKIPIFYTHPDKNAYCRKLKDCFPLPLLQCCLQ